MSQKLLNRVFSAIAAFSLLVNSFSAPLAVYAQTTTPEPTAAEITPTPTPTVTAIANPTITPSPTPTSAQPDPILPPADVDAVMSTDTTLQQATSDSALPPPDFSQPTVANGSAELSPSVSTDKADYDPSETVTIIGDDFPVSSDLTIRVTWPDGVVRNSIGTVDATDTVTTYETGTFIFRYDLRGEGQEGEYLVEILMGTTILSTTTFRDSHISSHLCSTDTAGANDEPGQKDLTQMCEDYSGLNTSIAVDWNWDDTEWPGGNTGDACALFDNDANGFADYASCVTVNGKPATQASNSPRLYTCNDSRADRCAGAVLIAGSYTTSCGVNQSADQPFGTGDDTPNDTKATCNIVLSEVGGETDTELLDVCSFPSEQPNSDPSDCIIARTRAGKLEVKKALVPDTDNGQFNLLVDNVVRVSDVGDGGTTGELSLDEGEHTFSETAGTGTDLSTYTQTTECRDTNGTGNIVATTGTGAGPYTINIPDESDIVCVITNTLATGTLHVIKSVTNDNGGQATASAFTLHVKDGGVDVSGSPAAGSSTGTVYTLPSGSYVVSENTPPSGYTQTGFSGDCDESGNVTVVAGQEKTCTITNDDVQPLLTVTKVVISDNGGNKQISDFPLFVGGTPVTSGVQNGFDVGGYVVSETGQTGYSSVISGNCDAQGNVSLAIGDVKSCTITNNDIAPTLTLVKTVTSDNGGTKVVSDFPLFINGSPVTSGVPNSLSANVLYTATETTSFGYAPSSWGGDCAADGTITLAPGDNKTCTITNDDIQPKLTVTKFVVNDFGGNALIENFALYVGSTQVLSGVENGFDADDYFVSEIELDGYTASSWGGDCAADGSITLEVGEVYLCTITNSDQPASITLIKEVVTDNGGNAGANDFGLTVGGTPVNSGQTLSVDSNTPYALNEAGLSGYSFVSITGAGCPQSLGGTVTLDEGGSITCTITNDDDAPTLTLVKNVIKDNGGQAGPNDFGLTIGGSPTTSGTPVEVLANTPYVLNEVGLTGYSFVSITGDPECPAVLGGTATLDEGEDVTCTITNDDQQPTLTLVKHLPNDDGGNAVQGDFAVYIDGNLSSWGSHPINSGTYTISEDTLDGYTPSVWGDDCSDEGVVTLGPGESKTCEITNDDDAPTLTLVKNVIKDNGGQAGPNDFGLTIGGNPTTSGTPIEVLANTQYELNEAGLTGYSFLGMTGDPECPSALGETAMLDEGEDVTCIIINDDQPGTLTVIKVIDGGNKTFTDFTFQVNGGQPRSFEADGQNDLFVDAGFYTVTEPEVEGYSTSYDNNCTEVEVTNGGSATCTITNTRDTGEIIIHKVIDQDGDWETNEDWLPGEDWEFDIEGTSDDSSDPGTQTTDAEGDTLGSEVKTGEYSVIETVQPDWVLLIAGCGENGNFDQTDSVDGISVGKDETVECTFVNFLPNPGLTTTKVRSDSTPEEILVGDNSVMEITIENSGNVPVYDVFAIDFFDTDYVDFVSANSTQYIVFEDVGEDSGDYDNDGDFDEHVGFIVWDIGDMNPEESLTLFVTFIATAISPDSPEQVLATNGAGSAGCTVNDEECPEESQIESELSFANVDIDSLGIQIDKTNDKQGGANAGDEVTYTLVITNTGEGTAFNVEVEDNLPGGFSYINGTTEIDGSPSGDPVITGGGSKLTWNIGNVSNGEPVTITYKAKIDDSVTPGTYKNYATCREVFGEENDTARIIPQECNVDDSDVPVGQTFSYGGKLTPQVLGAAIELPATGSSTNLLLFALIVGGIGIFTKIKAYKMGRRKYAKN